MISTLEEVAALPLLPTEIASVLRLGGLAGYRAWREVQTNLPKGPFRCLICSISDGSHVHKFNGQPQPPACPWCFNTGVLDLIAHFIMAGTGDATLDAKLRLTRPSTWAELSQIMQQMENANNPFFATGDRLRAMATMFGVSLGSEDRMRAGITEKLGK